MHHSGWVWLWLSWNFAGHWLSLWRSFLLLFRRMKLKDFLRSGWEDEGEDISVFVDGCEDQGLVIV